MKNKILTFISTISIFFAVPAAADDICSDRPGLGSAPCTVPTHHWQIESDVVNTTWSNTAGIKNQSTVYFDPTIKLGLDATTDIELQIAPIVSTKTSGAKITGFGDTWIKLKKNLILNDQFGLSVIPMLKVPTADRSIGNGHWEGGIQLPTNFTIDPNWSIAATSEIDFLKNDQNSGTHIQLQHSITLQRSIGNGVSLQSGLGTVVNLDKVTTRQYLFNVAVSKTIKSNLQLDAGINWGLNRSAPDIAVYTGISRRF